MSWCRCVYPFSWGEGGSTNSPYKKSNQMNLLSRKRNAGDALKFCTMSVPIPIVNTGGGTNIGTCQRLPPAFLFSHDDFCSQRNGNYESCHSNPAEINCVSKNRSAAWPLIAIIDCSALWLQICRRHICFTRRAPGEAVSFVAVCSI